MALFKIYGGTKEELTSSIPVVEGRAYFLEDTGEFFIDTATERKQLTTKDSEYAEKAAALYYSGGDGSVIEIPSGVYRNAAVVKTASDGGNVLYKMDDSGTQTVQKISIQEGTNFPTGTEGQIVGFDASGNPVAQAAPNGIFYATYQSTNFVQLQQARAEGKYIVLRVNDSNSNRFDISLAQMTDTIAVFIGNMADGKVKKYSITSTGVWSAEDIESIVTTDENVTPYEPPFDFNFGAGEGEAADAQWLLNLQSYLRDGNSGASLGDIVGKTKTITLTSPVLGTTSHLIRVIGVDQDAPNTVTWQTANCLANTTIFGDSAVWIDSTARTQCQNYYNAFPAKSAIMTVSKGTCADINDSRNGTVTYNDETVWLPSEREMGLDAYAPISLANSTTSNAECTQGRNFSYSYYTSDNSRIKKLGGTDSVICYWERSRHYSADNSGAVCYVDFDGSGTYDNCSYSYGFAPAYVIG